MGWNGMEQDTFQCIVKYPWTQICVAQSQKHVTREKCPQKKIEMNTFTQNKYRIYKNFSFFFFVVVDFECDNLCTYRLIQQIKMCPASS